jgi:hypothetical protein
LVKRGKGRFSERYVFLITDRFVRRADQIALRLLVSPLTLSLSPARRGDALYFDSLENPYFFAKLTRAFLKHSIGARTSPAPIME